MSVREQWDGNEWQDHCCRLLGLKHGDDIQFIPARVDGDGGMEAYRLDDGIVYQCYSPEDSFTVASQTESQKGKIRDDVGKLVNKTAETMRLLGPSYRIRRWILLTPDYDDKELVKYARLKSKRVRDSVPRPPWCHDDFQILIYNDRELFPAELKKLNGLLSGQIRLTTMEPQLHEVERHGKPFEQGLREKLLEHPQLAEDPDRLQAYCQDTLYEYVYGQKHLEALEARYGLAHEVILRRANTTYRTIRKSNAVDGARTHQEIAQLAQQLAASFSRDVPTLSSLLCDELAHHYIASWLIQCPLRLGGAAV
ncbi:hypothetical protein HH310_30945 [Actinoplanes sp. TBRC 11911]|uniref:hypothetical protein n=1 Tax=Actinoplanes sp. TBRC 11911 TaxID=2729386 RepID=UPI00145E1C17|nr:hypothetical protein [Actinoplanes sp. TBRC 11911]NMO55590.1 hypothetical protein [Actinoplanes sp. TBRC 11911]